MAIPVKHFRLISLMLLALVVMSSAVAVSDSPFIVAHKKVALQRLKSGAERVTVSIDIYNRGSEVAYDVSLADDNWGQDMFAFVNGETSNSWERLEGGTHASHSFELESKVKGKFYGAPARITFRAPTKAALQVAYSNDILPLDILADGPIENKFEWAKAVLANYGPQISTIAIVALFVYLITTPSKSSAVKGSKKRH